MNTRRVHPILCFLVLAAYLLNLSAAAAGAVLCQEPAGETSIEFVCEHDHCEEIVIEIVHDHSLDNCWCATTCPCDDTQLVVEITPLFRNDKFQSSSLISYTLAFVSHSTLSLRLTNSILFEVRPHLTFDNSLRQLRTVVLIV